MFALLHQPQALTYKLAEGSQLEDLEEQDRHYLSDAYKRTVLQVRRVVCGVPCATWRSGGACWALPTDNAHTRTVLQVRVVCEGLLAAPRVQLQCGPALTPAGASIVRPQAIPPPQPGPLPPLCST